MDSVLKWRGLPLRQALPAMREAAGRLDRDVRKGRAISRITAGLSGPSLSKLLESQGRLERRLALLRCVEALRLHAANNQGKWPPPSLDVVKVPLPVDPFTGKPFSYKVDGNKAVLTADYLRVLSTDSAVRRYEVTLKK
jgi:hypothetical protein